MKKKTKAILDPIAEGIKCGLIRFENDGKRIVYCHEGISRNYENPEERVQAEAFLSLILRYNYPVGQVRQFVSVTMGSSKREADIEVYADAECKTPLIIVECKKQEVSEAEFSQAVEQAFSYAVAEGAKYVWATSGIKNEYYEVPAEKPKERRTIPDIPQAGVQSLNNFKYAYEGGLASNGQQLFALKTVTEDELTRRFKQAHQALWGGGALNPSDAFDEFDKLIFCKIWDERKDANREPGDPYDFQIILEKTTDQTNSALLARLKRLYEEGRKQAPEVFKDDIRLSPEKVRTVVSYLEDICLSETDLDSKGRAFETFMGSFFRGNFGQFFTPRPVVKFIVDVLPIKNTSRVLDTSCGSGGFLLHALDKVRKLADKKYAIGSDKHWRYWHDFAEKNLFGIEINEQIARTAKMNMIIHDDGHTNVVACDGLIPPDKVVERTKNTGFKEASFDFIITNPPFGSIIRQTEQAYFHNYRLATREADWLTPKSKDTERPGVSTEVLFIEQCWNYLVEGGYLAVVIPDGILTNSSLQYARNYLEEKFRIVAVVSLPQTTFAATGAGVKSSVLFLRKHRVKETGRIRALKDQLKDEIKSRASYEEVYAKLVQERKAALDKLNKCQEFASLSAKERKANETYCAEAQKITDAFSSRLESIKEKLEGEYAEARKSEFLNYDIFMAIAEDIGFDATGRQTKVNELDEIGEALTAFIRDVDKECV